jgi:hypothetical protein
MTGDDATVPLTTGAGADGCGLCCAALRVAVCKLFNRGAAAARRRSALRLS